MAAHATTAGASGQADPVAALLEKVRTGATGVVQGAELLLDKLAAAGLVYEMDINPRNVGFDFANRDGEGGNAQEVLLLASDIAAVGWSWQETAHAVCVEAPPGDRTLEEFNRSICDGCGLAPVEPDSIRYGSLSCGHTNMGLRAIAASVPSECPLLSQDGRLSVAKVAQRDAEMAKAVAQGLHWKVLRHEVRARYPEVLSVVQARQIVSKCYLFAGGGTQTEGNSDQPVWGYFRARGKIRQF